MSIVLTLMTFIIDLWWYRYSTLGSGTIVWIRRFRVSSYTGFGYMYRKYNIVLTLQSKPWPGLRLMKYRMNRRIIRYTSLNNIRGPARCPARYVMAPFALTFPLYLNIPTPCVTTTRLFMTRLYENMTGRESHYALSTSYRRLIALCLKI